MHLRLHTNTWWIGLLPKRFGLMGNYWTFSLRTMIPIRGRSGRRLQFLNL